MHRLPVPSGILAAEQPALPPDAAKHLKVVRPKPGEIVELFDGKGRIRRFAWDGARLSAAGDVVAFPAPARRIALFACVTKGSRWDWTIEKAVELGASCIVPVISERSIVRLTPEERPVKGDRWRRIALDAARQSDAVWLPEVLDAVDFPDALLLARKAGRMFVGALVDPSPPSMWDALHRGEWPDPSDCGIFIGPEGDFTKEELDAILEFAEPVSLGPTILRAETAAIFGLSVLSAAMQSGTRSPDLDKRSTESACSRHS